MSTTEFLLWLFFLAVVGFAGLYLVEKLDEWLRRR